MLPGSISLCAGWVHNKEKTRYCGHQSALLCRGQVLWLVGGTDLYYKREWDPRGVHRDSLGTTTDCWEGGKCVCNGGKGT
jgi:hypothetical protein